MLPALLGLSAKTLLPSTKKVDKDKLLSKKSAAIQPIKNQLKERNGLQIRSKAVSVDKLLTPATTSSSGKLAISERKGSAIIKSPQNTIESIVTTLVKIRDLYNNKNKIDKKNEEEKTKLRKKKEKGKDEDTLEGKGKLSFTMPKIKVPNIPFIDQMMNFFGNILIGSLVLFIYKKIEEIINFFQETFLKIKQFFELIEPIVKPIWEGLKWIVGGGANIIAKILDIPSQEADTNGVKKNLEEITKKIPVIGNLFKGIQNIIDSIRGYKEEPAGGEGGVTGGGYVSPAGGAKEGAYGIAQRIGANRQQWDIYRNTIAQIESGGRYDVAGGSGKYYDGRYQMGGEAKADAARILGIPNPGHSSNPNDPRRVAFRSNPQLQEQMFAAYTLANHGYLSSDPNYNAKQTVEQKLQVLGYAHNQGAGGASKWMRTGRVGKDGFGTAGTKYSNALREAFKRSPSYKQQQADTIAQQAASQAQLQTSSTQVSKTKVTSQTTKESPTQAQAISTQIQAQISPSQTKLEAPQAQVSRDQPTSAIVESVPQIMQQADYEMPSKSAMIMPISVGGNANTSNGSVGSGSIIPVGISKKESLNSYYQSQLIGFLYKQG